MARKEQENLNVRWSVRITETFQLYRYADLSAGGEG